MYDVVDKKFTFAISSADELLGINQEVVYELSIGTKIGDFE